MQWMLLLAFYFNAAWTKNDFTVNRLAQDSSHTSTVNSINQDGGTLPASLHMEESIPGYQNMPQQEWFSNYSSGMNAMRVNNIF